MRPAVFIGSSTEGLSIARAVQAQLDSACEVEIWSQGVFGLTQGNLESLVLALDRFDFAVLVLTTDDLVVSRGAKKPVARDNVVFELGLFVGGLGRERTFMVYDRTNRPDLPSDLAGIAAADFEPHSSGNLEAAVGAACFRIENAIGKLGAREGRVVSQLDSARTDMLSAGSTLRNLIKLLARSRKVELDIITAQFGPVIEPQKLSLLEQDLEDLEAALNNNKD